MATFSVLSLGTRRDAKQFRKGAVEKLQLSPGSFLHATKPSLNDLKSLFARSDDVLFLAGHFSNSLYNDDQSIDLEFGTSKLTITYDGQTVVLNRGTEFKQTSCKLIIWGGCNVCSSAQTIATMRALFGPHVLVGWVGVTGWEITDIMFGGKGHGSAAPEPLPDFAMPNYFSALGGSIGDSTRLWKEWLKVAKAISWGNDAEGRPYLERFCVVDATGKAHYASEAIA
ncbi:MULTISPECIES: hypothetical protein [Sinorhizobium]|uniref:hypothetical protein n=1 Tax=Sinorhizobium TaxID=28105 RepID=UPI0024B1ED51|nr:hypothetical protein [Sinorhizobium terangae]WFU51891.1 hypothetical protein QA637_28665 [Sinorhizobium terangae]